MNSDDDAVAWAQTHQACFEIGPLIEMRGSEKIHVGFTIDLYARLPMEKAAGIERREEASRTLQRLREIVSSLAPAQGSRARVEIEPPRTAVFLRPENDMEPEVSLRARVFHGDDYFAAVTADERARISDVGPKLTAMGLRMGHW